MTDRQLEIVSYFSFPTDLAELMGTWPEFVEGQGYEVRLSSIDGQESVEIRRASEDEIDKIVVTGSGAGDLFDRALGCVTYALACHSDNLLVSRRKGL